MGGFDSMKAWNQRTFEFNDHIQRRGISWSGKFSYDSVEGLSIVHPNYSPPPSPTHSTHGSPGPHGILKRFSPAASFRSSPEPLDEDAQTSASSRPRTSVSSGPEPEPPSFAAARSRWRPTGSVHYSSDRVETPPLADSACELDTPPISPKDQQSLADKLYAAACAGDIEHMRLLLSIGAPISMPSLIADLYDSFKPSKAGYLSALCGAASTAQLEAVKFLLANGAELNPDVRSSSSSPLHQACRADDVPTVRYLLDVGADIDSLNCYRTTPIMYAVKYGSAPLVAELISRKPDLHIPSFINTAAIHWAVWPGDPEIMNLLLGAGADADHRMGDGSTPLHCAAIADLPEVAECLLRHGADPRLRNVEGQTAAQIAEDSGYTEMAEVLGKAELEARRKT